MPSDATRGTSVHTAAEILATTVTAPPLAEFPDADRGYVQALAKSWLANAVRPSEGGVER